MSSLVLRMLLTCSLFAFAASSASASWLVFSKPEFKGRIIDAETKQPIEGVVIVAMYRTHTIVGFGGGDFSIIHVKEALTDAKGEFHIPAYNTLIQPNSYEDTTDFIIYKPGYASYPHRPQFRIYPLDYCGPEILFAKEIGSKGEIRRKSEVIPIVYGIAELQKIETKEERLRAIPSFPFGSIDEDEVPLLYKTINEERKRFGLGPIGRVQK